MPVEQYCQIVEGIRVRSTTAILRSNRMTVERRKRSFALERHMSALALFNGQSDRCECGGLPVQSLT